MQANSGKLPEVSVSRRGADRLRAGHVWVYRSDIVSADRISPGALVSVVEERGRGRATGSSDKLALNGVEGKVRATRPLGTAFYSTSSEIALRLVSRGPVTDMEQLLREKIRAAVAYRERFVENSNAYRVIFSEGDFLPGLIVDRYNDVLSMQVLTQAMDSEQVRQVVISELVSGLNPGAIVERVDARVRKLEQLPEKESGVIWPVANGGDNGETELALSDRAQGGSGMGISPVVSAGRGRPAPQQPITTEFQMNGVRFIYEALGTQKTGAFLDQRENYAAAERYARGEALDVFCYQGGFSLHLARACDKVTGVDSSRPALEIADRNAGLNGKEIDWIEGNAFDLLRDYSDSGRKYDCIVLDPPAFAKSKRELPTAMRGYKELNLRALKMLRPGGTLVTCSCSYHVSPGDLLETLQSAARDSHRIVRILENHGAAKDHPNVLGIPETAYLKCVIADIT